MYLQIFLLKKRIIYDLNILYALRIVTDKKNSIYKSVIKNMACIGVSQSQYVALMWL